MVFQLKTSDTTTRSKGDTTSRRSRRSVVVPSGLATVDDTGLSQLSGFAGEVEVIDACWSNCVEVGAPGIRRMFDRMDMAAADLEGSANARLAIRDVVREYRAGLSSLDDAHRVVRSVLLDLTAAG